MPAAGPAPPVYLASLRVYEPVAAFPEPAARHWRAYAARTDRPSAREVVGAAHRRSLEALLGVPPRGLPDDAGDALVHDADGLLRVCPLDTRLRSWLALDAFRSGLAPEVADAFVPAAVAERARTELESYRRRTPDLRGHVVTTTWTVPPRWFVPFAQEEREVSVHAAADGSDSPAVRYRTAMASARRRVARALSVLRRALDDAPVVAGVEALGRWLEEFHPHSLVELDYGGLAGLLDAAVEGGLAGDTSADDIAAALAALAAGEPAAAGEAYERVTARWRAVAALEQAS